MNCKNKLSNASDLIFLATCDFCDKKFFRILTYFIGIYAFYDGF